MVEEKKLYPLHFIPILENPSEDILVADLGYQDSMVRNGWLSSNTISEIMETYMDRVVGEHVFDAYGRQFPISVRVLKGLVHTPLMVCPDDEIARQRYDFLGKAKLWYISDVKPGARIYLGFKEDVDAGRLFAACFDGSIEHLLNAIEPKPGYCYLIPPGLVHSAGEGVTVIETAEASPLDFRIFNWGLPFDGDEFDAELNLEAAMDFIDYRRYECHDIEGTSVSDMVEELVRRSEFKLSKIDLKLPVRINADTQDSFSLYTVTSGAVIIRVDNGSGDTDEVSVGAGECVLVPSEVSEFYIVPKTSPSTLLEVVIP